MNRKRFNSERAILAEIFQAQRDSNAALAEAEQMEATGRAWIKHPEMVGAGMLKLEEARKLRDRAARLIDIKAKKLGEKLAQFRTEPMPFLGGDRSVQQ